MYDDNFIYVGAICYDDLPGDFVVQSLKRDFSYPANDAFAIYLDPFNDKVNGFNFTVSPMGVQREGLLAYGGSMGVSTDWDCTWYSAVKVESGKWIVEMAIPFRSIRFSPKVKTWGVNFSRNDLKRNENSAWFPVPKNFNIGSLAYTGTLVWDSISDSKGVNTSLIPYITGMASLDHLNDSLIRLTPNGGLDAKIAVSNSLNLDITVNPDFSQVEVDRQVTNLTRFSVFFPEKRNFFVENSDLFDRYGFRQIRPFFSRRIGLYEGNVIPIYGGLRLSGKLNRDWRIGILSMQTDKRGSLNLFSQNYTVAAIQRRVFTRSNIAAVFVNRQAFDTSGIRFTDYNRIAGIDYNLSSKDNRWFGKAFYHYSFNPSDPKDSYSHASFIKFDNTNYTLEWNHEYVGENYIAETGFVTRNIQYDEIKDTSIRKAYWRLDDEAGYFFFPESGWLNKHGAQITYSHYLDENFKNMEMQLDLEYILKPTAGGEILLNAYYNDVVLPWLTDVSFSTGLDTLPEGSYRYLNGKIEGRSTDRNRFFFSGKADVGQYFTGMKYSFGGELTYRLQPWGLFSLNYSQDEIDMPEPLPNASITLIGTRIELSLSKTFFFTSFLQYNTQADNVNINCRLQWRYRPMSDIFIVYTDNYFATSFSPKNKVLVVKLNYWLNL